METAYRRAQTALILVLVSVSSAMLRAQRAQDPDPRIAGHVQAPTYMKVYALKSARTAGTLKTVSAVHVENTASTAAMAVAMHAAPRQYSTARDAWISHYLETTSIISPCCRVASIVRYVRVTLCALYVTWGTTLRTN